MLGEFKLKFERLELTVKLLSGVLPPITPLTVGVAALVFKLKDPAPLIVPASVKTEAPVKVTLLPLPSTIALFKVVVLLICTCALLFKVSVLLLPKVVPVKLKAKIPLLFTVTPELEPKAFAFVIVSVPPFTMIGPL